MLDNISVRGPSDTGANANASTGSPEWIIVPGDSPGTAAAGSVKASPPAPERLELDTPEII